MKVLVTGATGFVGSHAVAALLAAGHEVRLLARSRERVERVLGARGLVVDDVALGDMTDADAARAALAGCDAALHTAATMYGRSDVLDANVAGVRNVVAQACEMGLDPVLYTSSIAAMFPPPGPELTVDDPVVNLDTAYGRSKAEGERLARELQARGAPLVTLYPAAVHGPDDPVPGEGTKGLIARVRFGWPRTSGGTSCVDVRDVAAIAAAALEPGRGPRRFMAGGHFLSWMQEADVCERLIGRKVRRVPVPAPVVRAIARLLDLLKRVVDIDYPLTHEAAQFLTRMVPCDSRATVAALGVSFRPSEETLADAIRWLYATGQLAARYVPRIAAAHAPALDSGAASG